MKFGGHEEIKTEVQKKTFSPVWQEKVSIPTKLPTMADVITLQVRDWDKVSTLFLIFTCRKQ